MDKDLNLAWFVIFPFAWLYFAFAKGTEGENQYGKSPKQLRFEEKIKEEEKRALTNPTDIDLVLQKLETQIYPATNKAEFISFQLNKTDERLFYSIPPKNVKRLKERLELLATRLKDSETSYGYRYAERQFCIGDEVIFSWKHKINV